MTVLEAIQGRRSVRSYQDKEIEPEKLRLVLEAGRLAPSAKNEQAWRFFVVTDREKRAQMAQACCNQAFVGQAPVVLVICADNPRNMRCGQPARTVDCSIALSFMMLEAWEQGLGTCWIGAFDAGQVRAALQIPAEFEIVAVSPLGYPARQEPARPRKLLEEVACTGSWTF